MPIQGSDLTYQVRLNADSIKYLKGEREKTNCRVERAVWDSKIRELEESSKSCSRRYWDMVNQHNDERQVNMTS